jgi:hypothetical protein
MSKAPAQAAAPAPGVTLLDEMGSNVAPKEPTMADMMAMMQKLMVKNADLEARLNLTDVIDRPSNPNEVHDPMFPRQVAEPVARTKIRRVWIILEQNSNIPRNGLQLGVNGYQYLLRPGLRAHVPIGIVDNLKHAIEGKPIVDPDTLQVKGYEPVLRFPFRIVREQAPDPSARPRADDYEPDAEAA